MKRPRMACALMFAGVASGLIGCALPMARHTALAMDGDATILEPDSVKPIVQIREYPSSPEVAIVAWAPDQPEYGLRAALRRDGRLIRDHHFYVSTYSGVTFSPVAREPSRLAVVESVTPPEHVLKATPVSRDVYACFYGKCSPFEMRGVRVPDELLRANRDSLAVRFYGRGGGELVLTLHRDVIDAYLATVDSVSAALRKK